MIQLYPCELCGRVGGVYERYCLTNYYDKSLNKTPVYCEECWQEYLEYWKEQWEIIDSLRG